MAPDSKTDTVSPSAIVIDDGRHAVVRADREELGLELVALADVHRNHAVRQTAFLQHDRDLPAVRRRPVIEVDHASTPSVRRAVMSVSE